MTQRVIQFIVIVGVAMALVWYIGTPAHLPVLVTPEKWSDISQATDNVGLRGLYALWPMLEYAYARFAPLTVYALVFLGLHALIWCYWCWRHPKRLFSIRVNALRLLILGLFSLWLMHTSLFYGTLADQQYPLPEKSNLLFENFLALESRGCVQKSAEELWSYNIVCAQSAFIFRVLPPLGILALLTLNALTFGSLLRSSLRLEIDPSGGLQDFIICIALGLTALIMLLWSLALMRFVEDRTAWILLLGIPLCGWKYVRYWLQVAYQRSWRISYSALPWQVLLFCLLLSYLCLNYLSIIRPFPIGWDDLTLYLNAPKQLSAFGHWLPEMAALQWGYISALGFILFGSQSDLGAVVAQAINWSSGVLAVLALYVLTRHLLGAGSGLLAALFFYTLPMIGYFSFLDLKTENALFFFGTLGVLGVVQYASSDSEKRANWLIAAGIFCAVAFATKPTAILVLFLGVIILSFALLGGRAAIGSMLLSLWLLAQSGTLSYSALARRVIGGVPDDLHTVTDLVLLATGASLLLLSLLKNTQQAKPFAWAVLSLSLGFSLISLPWMTYNVYLNQRFSIDSALRAPDLFSPRLSYATLPPQAPPGSRALPAELQPDVQQCQPSAKKEELDRYWGYRFDIMHYLGLPWRVVMNQDVQGYYVMTSPLLLIIPMGIFGLTARRRRFLRYLYWGTAFYTAVWVVVGNGVPWYGIGMFMGFAVLLEALFKSFTHRVARMLMAVLLGVALVIPFSLRMWQFERHIDFYDYAWGIVSAQAMQTKALPHYEQIADTAIRLSENPERPYLYRIGTFIPYFIPRSGEIIAINDNQLDFFNCINLEQDHRLTLQRLRALGIHSIVFDMNTANIERNKQGSLHRKVRRFLAFVNDQSLGIQRAILDPKRLAYFILP